MVLGARKVGAEARARYAEDTEKAQQLPELLEAARKAEEELLRARREGADVVELNRLGVAYDAALTEAMRAAYAHQRVLVGLRGYEDRIYRRRRLARPEVKKATEVAERLLSLREQHRLHGIERVPRSPVTA
ncbi:hypothetical protein JCM3263A_24790 [Thermobifida fusca]|jgi:hypothetical protein|uniref:Uncharacterized protein n=2 Tax=Thermobifida fusca TaxID=2021 RepID=A0A9P2WQF8_THEFU|nr:MULTISPECIES: hypothetical protein [Thermobifida]AAZ55443.1 hypothetical protein Tfu_1405 [Thermobifida fusca YX]EOR71477.1 hypothetical protein TM51_07396 [Thermobifida fusca TM51]MBO2530890.1 hypothetical protein [Thermobifida sp.]MDD6793536.1 hypothetical protein [Thermobifida fusca]PPS91697.1 hypothetical protein BH05_13655 [Thermobifida fusca]